MVCIKCGSTRQRQASKNWNAEHPDYHKVNTKDKYRKVEIAEPVETQQEKEIRHFNEWFQELQDRFGPPVAAGWKGKPCETR